MPAAGGKAPAPGDPDAAVDRDAAAGTRELRPPGEDAARRSEDLARHPRVEIGGGHRAARILPERPGGAGVGLDDLLEHLDIGQRVELRTAQRARQQHAEEAALDQRLDDPLRELAALLDLVRSGCQLRRHFARPVQVIDGQVGAAQIKRGRRRHHVLRLMALLSLALKLHRVGSQSDDFHDHTPIARHQRRVNSKTSKPSTPVVTIAHGAPIRPASQPR